MSIRLSVKCYFIELILHPFVLVHGILGGYNISILRAPYQVNYGDVCGGVLIHPSWSMTSAHCGTETYIRVGSKYRLKGPQIYISSHFVHPKYMQKHTFDYDIQLLHHSRRLHFSERVAAVKISYVSWGANVMVSGWGYKKEKGDYSDVLQQVALKITPMEECQSIEKQWYNHTLTDRMFCAGGAGRDACQGDSGGGAISRGRLIGISSFGYGCGRNIPGVYTNLTESSLRKWIHFYTGV